MSTMRASVAAMLAVYLGACGDGATGPVHDPHAAVADATLTGPVGDAGLRGHALWDSWYDLAELGYSDDEYFVSGEARSATGAAPAAYTTRIIVRRPLDPARFNGTVLLDWVNVTAQFENAVDTLESHQLFQREGFAYVHVSAQAAGLCCLPALTPKMWDPQRYADIDHPGDDYAFDIFSQIAKALKQPRDVDPIGMPVRAVIAMGQSQSASRLYTYVNEVQPHARVIDGFLIHSGGGKTYDPPPQVPVIQLFSEAEADPEPIAEHSNYRGWEFAGAAHQNFWVGLHQVIGQAARATVDAPRQPASADADLHATAANFGEQIHPAQLVCIVAGSQFPMRYGVNAAIHHLDRWIKTGVAPPQAPRYAFDSSGALARDSNGNGLGGIRYPMMDVPVARYASTLCGLGGITVPFTELQLMQRYPTHADYYCSMQAATRRSVMEGFLLGADGDEIMQRVESASNRWLAAGLRDCP